MRSAFSTERCGRSALRCLFTLLAAATVFVAEGADPAPVPDAVLRAAAEASRPVPPAPAPPTAAARQAFDLADAHVVAATALLELGQLRRAGERFVAAVRTLAELTPADRRALGDDYRDLRRRLSAIAAQVMADPAVGELLGDAPLVPTPGETAAAVAAPAAP